ncbi:ExbD/TolR family protein [Erythrobacter crassostreae]|uniref:ExbD/TolR family protein n=1 Tax=Erythrobacter crassostreae TaxID=2828328 RepID=A0A9X1JJL5_9SPHN|nr:ExbD/TolR family protein [Erythrobacter crassostrea]MBV7257996.1 ExbD/TolR family protein [Erythrobacter crassostrea]
MAMSLASSRSGRRSRRAPMAEINVTPFVDVMLVLLIIFMVTAPLLAVGVPIELPDSRANPVDQTPEQITISVDGEGVIFIDNEAVETGGFPAALAAIDRQADGQLPVIVFRGDRAVEYGRTMAVLGELNRAGFTNISLVTSGSVSPP